MQVHLVTITALAEFPDRLQVHIAAVPADRLDWTPPGEDGASALVRLGRVIDGETAYQLHITRAVAEDTPDLSAAEAGETPTPDSLDATLAAVHTHRKRTLSILEGLTPEQWLRPARRDGRDTCVAALVHDLCRHDFLHLATLQGLLGDIRVV